MNVQEYLDRMDARYRISRHESAFTSQRLARAEHVSGDNVIKPVVVNADGEFVMCALPASYHVDVDELRRQLDARHVALVDEAKLAELFPDCELGAAPPIGRIYGMTTLMDESLTHDDRVVFQAGTHTDAVEMTLAEYRRVAQPEVAHFGRRG
jgi:Ala-tRNA(Pro) deacylase